MKKLRMANTSRTSDAMTLLTKAPKESKNPTFRNEDCGTVTSWVLLASCDLHRRTFASGWIGLSDDRHALVREHPDHLGYDGFEPLADDQFRAPSGPEYRPARLYIREHRGLNDVSTA
ncbi:hypothetical protein [Halobaculum magnesiiphilum]|uniref:Uncharacterized protein n=1 Tax=Halobaculum magnesiiphilum TaxID=1017351 RepID=A0A8T8WH24_9EURY|nr:hypothetical protein [Halobaculum magnesiiphilum]QZP39149.1 hypothetical protein K6T50_11050 [Halobaculum magnesiiphilum]